MRLILSAVCLLLAAPAFAACSGRSDQAMSCAEGSMWDEAAGACAPIVVG